MRATDPARAALSRATRRPGSVAARVAVRACDWLPAVRQRPWDGASGHTPAVALGGVGIFVGTVAMGPGWFSALAMRCSVLIERRGPDARGAVAWRHWLCDIRRPLARLIRENPAASTTPTAAGCKAQHNLSCRVAWPRFRENVLRALAVAALVDSRTCFHE